MKSGFAVLWGRPNTGKSTLLNSLLGRKHVIVSAHPQTTRHRIAGVLHDPNYQVVFLDTPGIHLPRHKLGHAMLQAARSALQDVEVALLVVDGSQPPHDDDVRAAALLEGLTCPRLLVLNKADLVPEEVRPQREKEYAAQAGAGEAVWVSAMEGTGVEPLKEWVVAQLPEGEAYFPEAMLGDRPPEFHISELIREQLMQQLHHELPHVAAVTVEQMAPRKKDLLYLEAFIYVERDTHRMIVLGKQGSRIKAVGSAAREGIERLLGRPVFLDLQVKVRPKWRDKEDWLRRLGYQE